MQRNLGSRRNVLIIHPTRLSLLRTPWSCDLRPRSLHYLTMVHKYLLQVGNHKEHKHSVPPSNRWTIRTHQSNPWNLSPHILQS
jgi:hypothetical protein